MSRSSCHSSKSKADGESVLIGIILLTVIEWQHRTGFMRVEHVAIYVVAITVVLLIAVKILEILKRINCSVFGIITGSSMSIYYPKIKGLQKKYFIPLMLGWVCIRE